MAAAAQQMSQPKDYKLIVEKDVQIPLRDGTVLCGDIFRPDGGSERFPVIMPRTIAYRRAFTRLDARADRVLTIIICTPYR